RYSFLGPVKVAMETDEQLSPGMLLVSGEIQKREDELKSRLVLPDGRTRELGTRPVTIGRLPDCGVVLADPNVSRYHAEIRPIPSDHGSFEIADMGSTNGTRLNGTPIVTVQPLRPGDQITVGSTTLSFERS
ncbi:MAG: FHA domain-containing protein, partial [Acidimicrobiales bacterium]|nr:FHA domain-containing protein [Acidimicrobiales bacterium]